MKKINTHIIFITSLFLLSLFLLNSILHRDVILDNIHYINDLTFLSYNVKEALEKNELALWTPYFYAGHPLLAIPENYMFDLNFLLIYLFKDIYLAMNLSLIFYLFFAGLGMYILIYNLIASKKAAFISAIIYMFNGFMHSFLLHGHINLVEGYALMPIAFLFIHKALKSKDWIFWSILAGIFFAMYILAGSIILFFYTAFFIFIYFMFNLIGKDFIRKSVKSLLIGILLASTALSLASIKLLPVLEFTKLSSRAVNVSFQEFLGHPINFKDIVRVIITDIGFSDFSVAVGVTGFILLVFGLLNYKKRIVAFSIFLVIFSVLFASGTFIANVMYKIPGFEKQRHIERSLVLFVFAASILAAYGFVFLSEKLKQHQKLKYENLLFAGIILLVLIELFFLHSWPTSSKIVQPKEIELLDYISKDNSKFRIVNLAQKDIIGAAGYNYYAQKGISEVKGGGGIWVNDYATFVSIAQQSLNSKIFGILNVKYTVSDRELDANHIRFISKFKECKECAVWNAFGPYLYKNEDLLLRYYVVPNSILVVGENKLVKQLIYSLMFQNFEPRNTVLIEGTNINDYGLDLLNKFKVIILAGAIGQDSVSKLREFVAQGGILLPDIFSGQNSISNDAVNAIFNKITGNYTEINISEYSNNKVILDLNGEKGWLVASERFAHFPGWKASINGKYINILKADNAITALYLDGEKGNLVFEYKPDSYRKGKIISLIALIMIVTYFGYFIYKKLKRGDSHQT